MTKSVHFLLTIYSIMIYRFTEIRINLFWKYLSVPKIFQRSINTSLLMDGISKQILYWRKEQRRHNTGLAKVAVQCSADTFVVNQSLVLRINPPRRMVKIATFAKPETVITSFYIPRYLVLTAKIHNSNRTSSQCQ